MDVNSYSQTNMVVLTAAINLLISQHTRNVMTPQLQVLMCIIHVNFINFTSKLGPKISLAIIHKCMLYSRFYSILAA